jgi:cell division protein FtsB
MRIVNNPWLRLGITIISLIISIGLVRSIIGHFQRNDVVEESHEVLQKEEQRNKELQSRLKEATSSAYVEKQAREKLGLALPGDTIVLLGESKEMHTSLESEQKQHSGSHWEQWWKLFF